MKRFLSISLILFILLQGCICASAEQSTQPAKITMELTQYLGADKNTIISQFPSAYYTAEENALCFGNQFGWRFNFGLNGKCVSVSCEQYEDNTNFSILGITPGMSKKESLALVKDTGLRTKDLLYTLYAGTFDSSRNTFELKIEYVDSAVVRIMYAPLEYKDDNSYAAPVLDESYTGPLFTPVNKYDLLAYAGRSQEELMGFADAEFVSDVKLQVAHQLEINFGDRALAKAEIKNVEFHFNHTENLENYGVLNYCNAIRILSVSKYNMAGITPGMSLKKAVEIARSAGADVSSVFGCDRDQNYFTYSSLEEAKNMEGVMITAVYLSNGMSLHLADDETIFELGWSAASIVDADSTPDSSEDLSPELTEYPETRDIPVLNESYTGTLYEPVNDYDLSACMGRTKAETDRIIQTDFVEDAKVAVEYTYEMNFGDRALARNQDNSVELYFCRLDNLDRYGIVDYCSEIHVLSGASGYGFFGITIGMDHAEALRLANDAGLAVASVLGMDLCSMLDFYASPDEALATNGVTIYCISFDNNMFLYFDDTGCVSYMEWFAP